RLLIDHYGTERLLQLLETRLRSISQSLHRDRTPEAERNSDVSRAMHLLEGWPDAFVHSHISSLFLCPDTDRKLRHSLRCTLWERLWRFDREQALATAQAAAEKGDD